ncbi:MAG: aminotransferase class IV [Myxococcota bacterium]
MTATSDTVVMIDGLIVPPEGAVISVFDRGFLYGDSVYEVMRTYDRAVFALREHIERLYQSARRVHIDIPIASEQMRSEALGAVAASPIPNNSVRIHVTRGSGPLGLDTATARAPSRVIIVTPVNTPSNDDYRHGIGVALIRTQRTVDNTDAAGAKVANYLVSLMALRDAQAVGAKEAIILDGRGRVLEGATSNVFVVSQQVLLTPPDTEGILPGITRSYLLRAAESIHLPARVTTLTRGDLLTADEVFISSTSREVLPVTRVDQNVVGNGQVGPVTREIHRAFRRVGGLPTALPGEEGD